MLSCSCDYSLDKNDYQVVLIGELFLFVRGARGVRIRSQGVLLTAHDFSTVRCNRPASSPHPARQSGQQPYRVASRGAPVTRRVQLPSYDSATAGSEGGKSGRGDGGTARAAAGARAQGAQRAGATRGWAARGG